MDLHLLRLALSHHLGQQLTPELADRIEFIACAGEDLSIDPARFEPAVAWDYVIQVERLRAITAEMHALHDVHWAETEKHRQGLPLSPDYRGMQYAERAGRLVQFTVRSQRDRQLVGGLRMYLGTSMHTGTLFAQEDTLFLLPAHRGGFLAIHLLRYAERVLVDHIGVREIRADSKVINNADVLMRRMRYRHVSNGFVKVFPLKSEAPNVL